MNRAILSSLIAAVLALFAGVWLSAASAEDLFFRCPGELYTNRARPGCERYTFSSTLGVRATPPAADRLATIETSMPTQTPVTAQPSAMLAQACRDYAEWIALDNKTIGGTQNQSTQEHARWIQLSRRYVAGVVPIGCQ